MSRRYRTLLLVATALVTTYSHAFPGIYTLWAEAYPEATADDELVSTAGTPCQVCHVGPGGGEPWNAYGFAVLQNGGFANVPQAFFDIENQDADGEGTSNIDEIVAGALPGWCDPASAGCQNLGFTRTGASSPAAPPAGVTLDPPGLQPPAASTGGPYSGRVGLRVAFDGSGATDADGTVVSWHWKFGDGGASDGPRPAYVYGVPGSYSVTLKVIDNDGLADIAETTIVISEPDVVLPPVANAGGPYTGFAGTGLAFDGSGSVDADGAIVTWRWQFGDGATGSGATPEHIYATAGNYVVTLTVTDDDGLAAQDQTSAAISPPQSPGETIYRSVCQACHGDPWDGPAIDPGLVAGRRNTGARVCSINGAINGTAVFPGGVPQMQFLQGLYDAAQIQSVSDFLNSQLPVSGQRRFVTTCAGCHGVDASGGAVNEDVRGRDAARIQRALNEVPQMAFLNCLSNTDIQAIGGYLETLDDD